MGLSNQVKKTYLLQQEVVIRPAETYAIGTHTLFNITGGPVWVTGLFGVLTEAIASGSTARHQINGVALDTAAVNINAAIGDVVLFPLDDTTTGIVVPAVAAASMPEPTGQVAGGGKVLATSTPGEIDLVIAGFNGDGDIVFYVVYYRMSPNSQIVVA